MKSKTIQYTYRITIFDKYNDRFRYIGAVPYVWIKIDPISHSFKTFYLWR